VAAEPHANRTRERERRHSAAFGEQVATNATKQPEHEERAHTGKAYVGPGGLAAALAFEADRQADQCGDGEVAGEDQLMGRRLTSR
jgi:hypothetical protein